MWYLYQSLYILPFDHVVWACVCRETCFILYVSARTWRMNSNSSFDKGTYRTCNTSTYTHSNTNTHAEIYSKQWEQTVLQHFEWLLQHIFTFNLFFFFYVEYIIHSLSCASEASGSFASDRIKQMTCFGSVGVVFVAPTNLVQKDKKKNNVADGLHCVCSEDSTLEVGQFFRCFWCIKSLNIYQWLLITSFLP